MCNHVMIYTCPTSQVSKAIFGYKLFRLVYEYFPDFTGQYFEFTINTSNLELSESKLLYQNYHEKRVLYILMLL